MIHCAYMDRYVSDACVAITVATMLFIVPSQKPNYFCFRRTNGICCPRKIRNTTFVCMYVCPKIYNRRALSKSNSRAAVSNKQKRLQWPVEPFTGQVGWAQGGWKTVPDPSSSVSETPIAECTVGTSNDERRSIRRSKRVWCADRSPRWADSRQQGTVEADRAATYGSAAPAWTLLGLLYIYYLYMYRVGQKNRTIFWSA